MKIVVSGGHLTPALAFIDFVIGNHPEDEIVFVGRRFSQDSTRQESQEQTEVEQRHIRFLPFQAPRFSRQQSLMNVLLIPLRFLSAELAALSLLRKEKPDVVLTFGGYLAVPLAKAAWLSHIPVVTHEQTHSAGFANQCIALMAQAVAVSYPESARYFPKNKTVVTGNPVRASVLQKSNQKPAWFTGSLEKPLLLITCGNQGSHTINVVIAQLLDELTKHWTVVHLVGNPTEYFDDQKLLAVHKEQLPIDQQQRYSIQPWVSGDDLAWLYTHATAAIARSGANTTQELALRHIPTLFIPLPFAHRDEQLVNAYSLVDHAAALMLEQKSLSAQTLSAKLAQLKEQLSALRDQLQTIAHVTDADQKLYQLVARACHAS